MPRVPLLLTLTLLLVLAGSGCANLPGTRSPELAAQAQQLLDQGFDDYKAGDYDRALESYQRGLALAERAGEPGLTADIHYRIGRAQWRRQRYGQALAAFERALALTERQGTQSDRALLHNAIGTACQTLGQFDAAQDHYGQALSIRRQTGDRVGEARTLVNLGSAHAAQARYLKALQQYDRAWTLAESVEPRPLREVAAILTHKGALYSELGQYDRALEFHRKARRVYQEQGDRSGLASSWHNIGYVRAEQRRYPGAIQAFRRAQAIREDLGDAFGRAGTLNSLGITLSEAGRHDEALRVLREALRVLEALNTRKEIAATLDSIGTVQRNLGDQEEALAHLYRSLAIWRQIGDRDGERVTLGNIGSALELGREDEAAIVFYKLSVNLTQELRGELKALPEAQRRAYAERIERSYRRLADLLIRRGRLAEAQQVLGMLKEQEYFEFIRGDRRRWDGGDSVIAFTDLEAPLAELYGRWGGKAAAFGRELGELKSIPRRRRTDAQQARKEELERRLADVNRAFERFMDGLRDEFAALPKDRTRELDQRQLALVRRQQKTLRALREHRPVMVHYVVLDQRVQIILTTPHTQVARHSNSPEAELNVRIQDLRDRVTEDPRRDPRPAARALYELLIGPIESELRDANAATIVVSLDKALRYVPFAALHDGERYLAERYGFAMLTEAAKSDLREEPEPDWTVAGFGVSKAHTGFDALPAVPGEIEGIVRHGSDDPDGVLPGEVYLDERFTERALAAALDDQHPVVHIASHFKFRPGSLRDSFILVGDGTHLSLADIARNNYEFFHVDLFTLSACDTGMSTRRPGSGKEVEGLGADVQTRGASSVLATLWSVEDASTGMLMRRFYALRAQGLSKSEALRRAQVEFLGGRAGAAVRADTRGRVIALGQPGPGADGPARPEVTGTDFRHPHFWAPFILMGNWL